MKLKIALLVSCFTLMVSCNHSDSNSNTISDLFAPSTVDGKHQKWNLFVGGWYGEAKLIKGGLYKFLVHLQKDRQLRHETKVIYEDGNIYGQIDTGEWGWMAIFSFTPSKFFKKVTSLGLAI